MISNYESLQLWRVFLPQLQASYKCRNDCIYCFWLIIIGIMRCICDPLQLKSCLL